MRSGSGIPSNQRGRGAELAAPGAETMRAGPSGMAGTAPRNLAASLSGALDTMLELSGAGRVVEACNRLSAVLETASSVSARRDLPPGVRPDLHRLIALLTLPNWNEILRWSALLEVDLRDLMEAEIAYAERVTIKTAQRWRSDGDGPAYRNEVGIRYPVAWYWEWRHKGRQTMTAQRVTRGRRRLL